MILWLALRLVRLFHPRITVRGAAPADGPWIVVANHPNGLVDPLVLRIALDRPIRFLAKSTFWENPVGRLAMESSGALPIHRAHEADTAKNDETFARCRQLLAEGGWLALFPEGKSHDATTLQPLKTGAARIARQAGVPVLPVGLLYEDKATFRTGVTVTIGRHLRPEGDVRDLTTRIQAALAEVVVEAEDPTVWNAFLAVSRWTGTPALDLAAAWRRLDADEAESVAEAVRRYARTLRAVGATDPFAVETAVPRFPAWLLLAPVALVGAILAWVPYRLLRPLAVRMAAGHTDIVGTLKLLLGVAVLTPVYLFWTGVGVWVHPWGAAMLLLGPATGYAALRFGEGWELRREAYRGVALRLFRPRLALALAERRRELVDLIRRTASPPPPPPPEPPPPPA